MAAKPLLKPKPLSRPLPPSLSPPSSGIAGRDGPCLRASAWRMCLAGEGGGKGRRRRRLAGVVGAGDLEPAGAGDLEEALGEAAEEEEKRWCAGLGLGVEKGKKGEDVQCFLEAGVAGAVEEAGGGVAGAGGGGDAPSASRVRGLAWQPPMAGAGGGWDLDRGGGGGGGARARRRKSRRPWRRGERERERESF